ncbi:uncharacterized protein [Parasteatoda tepidariorum]|uniref:uncharacterized protein isoform X2 n=1 Tax=Parasteatoda tepidariorum TaxID=114398 RepID=UPI0039BCAB39
MKPPLRTVLRNFLNHFEDYEARKKLYDDQYEKEFQQLKKLTDKLKNDNDYSCSCALKDVNRPKNRYKDIVPYDKSRVILPKSEGIPGSDYINASHIKGASGALAYIAAQGPLPNTVIDFWRMIWICDVQVVVMACNEVESGKNKCEKYWPSKGEVKHFGNISVELINTSQICQDFLIRTLLVKCDSEMRDVYQFHYTSWPDHGIPDTVHPILELVRLMRQCQASETMPIVVHCSAGCGRTGTICAVDFVWACLRHGKLSEDFSLFQIAVELRRQRIAMIQTKEQYILAHKVVATLFEQQLNVIDCHPYVNIDEDGEPLIWKELTKNKRIALKEKSPESTQSVDKIHEKSSSEKNVCNKNATNGSLLESTPEENSHQISTSSNIITPETLSSDKSASKISISDSLADCSKNSEISFSRNSYLSQQSNDDAIPFIDDDEVSIRPQCGRAYLNIPSCDSITKLVNRFDPFVDRVAYETDESSPESDSKSFPLQNEVNQDNLNGKTSLNTKYYTMTSSSNTVSHIAELSARSKDLSVANKRESYPSTIGRSTFQDCDSIDDKISIQSENIKGVKMVGRATVMRRPSVSKLKALFEKTGISTCRQSDGGKRSLFRNNTHHVSRAGSAPPSLNCMDRNSANERESILMMVTRKFRSSSVRTEREVGVRPSNKSQKRTVTNSVNNLGEKIATLSRTVSFNLNKKFRNNSTASQTENCNEFENNQSTSNSTSCNSNEATSSTKSKSMWYDKSSLPRVIAVVKPTEKIVAPPIEEPSSPTNKKPDKLKSSPFSFSINRPPKLLPFLSTLSKGDGKDTTMWYSETDNMYTKPIPTETQPTVSDIKSENPINNSKDISNRIFPGISSLRPWKKISKNPLNIPDAPKSPTFYAVIDDPQDKLASISAASEIAPICPVPEEIIPLSSTEIHNSTNSAINETVSVGDYRGSDIPEDINIPPSTTDESTTKQSDSSQDSTLPSSTVNISKSSTEVDIVTEKDEKDVPPAIPRKMLSRKNKSMNQLNDLVDEEIGAKSQVPLTFDRKKDPPPSPNDLYSNVNETAKKNIEIIEKALQINPRSAIIDLTSRESYCMEEELANAVKQLAAPQPMSPKGNSKFPGYEIIWPEDVALIKNQIKPFNESQLQCKTGICYSPPLRRSFKGSVNLSKSSSCSNIDWLEPNETVAVVDNFKEGSASPTKKLVKEAAVELNTLLDRLTTQTLSEAEDVDLKNKHSAKKTESSCNTNSEKSSSFKSGSAQTNLITHSVTILSKSSRTNSSPKEEEIVFHFPPPPRNPPPKEDTTSERFDIVVKNGSLIVSPNKNELDKEMNEKCLSSTGTQVYPQPAPRKSKIRKSASYTNLWAPQSKGYENVFLEKYQTLSRLQIGSENSPSNPGTRKEANRKPTKKTLPDYVNVQNFPFSENKLLHTTTEMSLDDDKLQNSKQRLADSNMSRSYPEPSDVKPAALAIDTSYGDQFSNYGKILKTPAKKQDPLTHQPSVPKLMNKESDRHLTPSRKHERAPLPPDVNLVYKTKDNFKVESTDQSVSSKRIPSRKQEKAPLPPPLLLKSSSAAAVNKNMSKTPYYTNFSSQKYHEDTRTLPAVRENIANTDSYLKLATKKEIPPKEQNSNRPSRGLSHSQSDASVFLALKERKAFSLNRDQKLSEQKILVTNKFLKRNKELASVSSSDSDSSYERIFFDKPVKSNERVVQKKTEERTNLMVEKDSMKELPVAPPRARRRNTTEIQYAKVKSKES